MDLEADKHSDLSDSFDENLDVEPMSIRLPTNDDAINEEKNQKKGKSILKSSQKAKAGQNDESIRLLYKKYHQIIEQKSNQVISSKNQKLSEKICTSLSNIAENQENLLNFITIKVYPNFGRSLQILYKRVIEKLNQQEDSEQQIQAEAQSKSIPPQIIMIDQKFDEIFSLTSFLYEKIMSFKLDQAQREAQNDYSFSNRQIVLLFSHELEHYNPILSDLCKYLVEEILSTYSQMRLFFVFPYTSQFPNIGSEIEYSLLKFEVTSPKKMFSKLLVDLIKDFRFLPILSTSLIFNLKKQFDNFETSFERTVQKLEVITQEYLLEIKDREDILELVQILGEETSIEEILKSGDTYGKLRMSIICSINVFIDIEKNIFGNKNNLSGKVIDFISKGKVQYGLPLQFSSQIKDLPTLKEVNQQIMNIIQSQNFKPFDFYIQKFSDLELQINGEKKVKAAKSLSKADKRAGLLLQKSSKDDETEQNINHIKNEISNFLRLFIQENIVQAYKDIEQILPNLVYTDIQSLGIKQNPDLLDNIYQTFEEQLNENTQGQEKLQTHKSLVQIIFKNLQDFGIKVDLKQCVETFEDVAKEYKISSSNRFVQQCFLVCLNELKYKGLISEARKAKLTMHKNFFGKCFFRETNINEEDQ